jgi:hypothetical protein
MTPANIITRVLSRCGKQENNTYMRTAALAELQLIQERLEGGAFMPWFLLSDEVTSLSMTANVRTTALPATFLREYEDFDLSIYDSTASDPYIELIKDEQDYLKVRFADSGPGQPTHYSLVGSNFVWSVTPDANYLLRGMWFEKEAVLADGNTDNAWTLNASDKLIAELQLVMATYRRDQNLIADAQQQIVRADARLLAFDEARKQANREAYRGDHD